MSVARPKAKLQDILTVGIAPLTPRLTVVLFPNTSIIEIQLNDRKFNNIDYLHQFEPEDYPSLQVMHKFISAYPALEECKIGQNTVKLEIKEGGVPHEIIPRALFAICEWAGDDYNPEIFVMDMRWKVEPVEDEFAITLKNGVRYEPHEINIGIPNFQMVD